MTRNDFIKEFAKRSGLDLKYAGGFLSAFGETVSGLLKKGEKVNLAKLGNFKVRTVPEHRGRNPRTGSAITIPEKRRITFRPSRNIGKKLNLKIAKEKAEKLIEYEKKKSSEIVNGKPEIKKIDFDRLVESSEKKLPGQGVAKEEKERTSGKEEKKTGSVPEDFLLDTVKYISAVYRRRFMIFSAIVVLAGLFGFYIFFKSGIPQKILKRKIIAIQREYQLTTEEVTAIIDTRLSETGINNNERVNNIIREETEKVLESQKVRTKKPLLIRIKKYRVKKGDTLWSISQKFTKTPYNWLGIYQTNGKKIIDPDKIYPGQLILIPVVVSH